MKAFIKHIDTYIHRYTHKHTFNSPRGCHTCSSQWITVSLRTILEQLLQVRDLQLNIMPSH